MQVSPVRPQALAYESPIQHWGSPAPLEDTLSQTIDESQDPLGTTVLRKPNVELFANEAEAVGELCCTMLGAVGHMVPAEDELGSESAGELRQEVLGALGSVSPTNELKQEEERQRSEAVGEVCKAVLGALDNIMPNDDELKEEEERQSSEAVGEVCKAVLGALSCLAPIQDGSETAGHLCRSMLGALSCLLPAPEDLRGPSLPKQPAKDLVQVAAHQTDFSKDPTEPISIAAERQRIANMPPGPEREAAEKALKERIEAAAGLARTDSARQLRETILDPLLHSVPSLYDAFLDMKSELSCELGPALEQALGSTAAAIDAMEAALLETGGELSEARSRLHRIMSDRITQRARRDLCRHVWDGEHSAAARLLANGVDFCSQVISKNGRSEGLWSAAMLLGRRIVCMEKWLSNDLELLQRMAELDMAGCAKELHMVGCRGDADVGSTKLARLQWHIFPAWRSKYTELVHCVSYGRHARALHLLESGWHDPHARVPSDHGYEWSAARAAVNRLAGGTAAAAKAFQLLEAMISKQFPAEKERRELIQLAQSRGTDRRTLRAIRKLLQAKRWFSKWQNLNWSERGQRVSKIHQQSAHQIRRIAIQLACSQWKCRWLLFVTHNCKSKIFRRKQDRNQECERKWLTLNRYFVQIQVQQRSEAFVKIARLSRRTHSVTGELERIQGELERILCLV